MRSSTCTTAWSASLQSIKALYQKSIWLVVAVLLVASGSSTLKTEQISIRMPLAGNHVTDTSFHLKQTEESKKSVVNACVAAGEVPGKTTAGAPDSGMANSKEATQSEASSVSATIFDMASVVIQITAAAVLQLAVG